MKKCVALFVVLLFCVPVRADVPEISAKSAVVIEYETGQTLFAENADVKRMPASTTKIMTALVVLESVPLTDVVTVSKTAAGTEGSSVYLKAGEKVTVETLLYGLLLASGNDAANLLAEYVSGNITAFGQRMTQRAIELGCTSTVFKNPSGLPEEGHYTTALDLARIAGAALQNETFRHIVSQKSASVGGRSFTNHNKLLSLYDGAIGVKTGYTKAAGRTLVSAAEKDGIRLIAVTLSDPDDWDDHAALLDYGFSRIRRETLAEEGDRAGNVSVENGTDDILSAIYESKAVLPVEIGKNAEIRPCLPDKITAPVFRGDAVGTADVFLNGVKMGEVRLIADADIKEKEKPDFWSYIRFVCRRWASVTA